MSQVLTLDLGNTNPHYCIFTNGVIGEVRPLKELSSEDISEQTKVIISNVGKDIPEALNKFNPIALPAVSAQKFLLMPVNYSASLGEDRLVQSYYLYKTMIEDSALLIDVGTFITIDKITKAKGHEGGFIFPGIKTFLQSYTKGARLPHIDIDQVNWESEIKFMPNNTYEAIGEASKLYLNSIFKEFHADSIYLTGGNSQLISKYLPSSKTQQMPHLIHNSLNYICDTMPN